MAKKFSEGAAVQIHDGASRRRGKVLKATADAYLVDTADGPIWCGLEHVFAPGKAPESLDGRDQGSVKTDAPPPLAVEANDAGEAGEAAEAGSEKREAQKG